MKRCVKCRKIIWFWQDTYQFRPTIGNKVTPDRVWHRDTCNPNIK